jgi:hypothetical protein
MRILDATYEKKVFDLTMNDQQSLTNPSNNCFVTFKIQTDLLRYTERGNVTIRLNVIEMPTNGQIKF